MNAVIAKVHEKDSIAFMGTEISSTFEAQRRFLLDLRNKIEKRHKEKGDGFMNLIRRN